MRSIVKARQARKNVEVWVRVNCLSKYPTYSIGFQIILWSASLQFFARKRGDASFFKMSMQ